MKKYHSILSENFKFLEEKFAIYLNRRVCIMDVKYKLIIINNDTFTVIIQSTLFILTLATMTKFTIMIIWLAQNHCSADES